MNKKYCCLLNSVEYHASVPPCNPNPDIENTNACPWLMRGHFKYDGFEPFEFEVRFDPMGGPWTRIKVGNRWKGMTLKNEQRYRQISDSAMRLACHNAGIENPDDFKWALSHDEKTAIL